MWLKIGKMCYKFGMNINLKDVIQRVMLGPRKRRKKPRSFYWRSSKNTPSLTNFPLKTAGPLIVALKI